MDGKRYIHCCVKGDTRDALKSMPAMLIVAVTVPKEILYPIHPVNHTCHNIAIYVFVVLLT